MTKEVEANSTKGVEVRGQNAAIRKVVINKCFGGFGLSIAAERAYLKRQGKEAFFYVEDRASAERPSERDLLRVDDDSAQEAFMAYTSTRDFGERVDHATFWGPGNETPDHYFYNHDIDRDDPDLVAVVEELGEAADGEHARLAVVEIPDGIAWEIDEYDGTEKIAEVHRTWS